MVSWDKREQVRPTVDAKTIESGSKFGTSMPRPKFELSFGVAVPTS